mgnify:CR=1 FL=1|jgi:hypothetical protein
MYIPDVSSILNQKLSEVQSRLPIKLNIKLQNDVSFGEVLNTSSNVSETSETTQNTNTEESAAPVIDNALIHKLNGSKKSKTKYPLVSGSYESVYTRLSQAEIQELMPRIDAAINKYSDQFGLDPKLVRAVIKQESGFQPLALSTSGAMGLMQLMPGTAAGLGVTDAYNIEQNIKGGTQYLYYQLKAFDGDLKLALAAYNAGPNAVRKYNGIPPYEQTQDYVKKVLKYYEMYKAM